MQNETITIGFTDGDPRVYVDGELRKSKLEIVWDEHGAIEKVYLALKPKQVTLTFCGEPIHNRTEVISIERVDGDVRHLRHKNCPSAGESLTEVGAVASAAKLTDHTWEVPVSDARVATCPLCERSLPLQLDYGARVVGGR